MFQRLDPLHECFLLIHERLIHRRNAQQVFWVLQNLTKYQTQHVVHVFMSGEAKSMRTPFLIQHLSE